MAYQKWILMFLDRDWMRIKTWGSKTGWIELYRYFAIYSLAPWIKAANYVSDVAERCVTYNQCMVPRPAKLGWTRYHSPHMQALSWISGSWNLVIYSNISVQFEYPKKLWYSCYHQFDTTGNILHISQISLLPDLFKTSISWPIIPNHVCNLYS